jgi:hypothetical protein
MRPMTKPGRSQEHQGLSECASPEQMMLYEGEEVIYPQPSDSEYSLVGFDDSQLYLPVPAPGVHPRIWFCAKDIPLINRRIHNSVAGQRLWWSLQYQLAKRTRDPRSKEGRVFARLASGDVAGLEWTGPHQLNGAGRWPHRPGLLTDLSYDGFEALLSGNDDRGSQVAVAFASYVRLLEPKTLQRNQEPLGDSVWRGMHGTAGFEFLGTTYDFVYDWLDDDQRDHVRGVIAEATSGKMSHGADMPSHWRSYNWMPEDTTLYMCALGIEGEEGYDFAIEQRTAAIMRDYLSFGITEAGTLKESWGKAGFFGGKGMPTMVALARRGHNLFGHPHLRALMRYAALCIQPWGHDAMDHGDAAPARIDDNVVMAMKRFFSNDSICDWLARQATGEGVLEKDSCVGVDWFVAYLLQATAWEGHRDQNGELLPQWDRRYLDLPLTYSDDEYGILITRSDWSQDALYLHFEARQDHRSVGHQHHDAGNFTLSALGRVWACESPGMRRDSATHSVIHIDGRGQGSTDFANPNVEYLGATDTPDMTTAAGSIKRAYDYVWTGPHHHSWYLRSREYYGWEPDTHPEVVQHFRGTQGYSGRIWQDSCLEYEWGPTMRAMYNPVEHAFRSVSLVRGIHPYCLVVDDIKKDSTEHLYEWYMQVPQDIEIAEIVGNDVTLAESPVQRTQWNNYVGNKPVYKEGQRLLLVRVLDVDASLDYPRWGDFEPVRMDQYAYRWPLWESAEELESGRPRNSGMLKRLVISSRSITPRFKIMLYPYRRGDELPTTIWNDARTVLRISIGGQDDRFVFGRLDSGRTSVSMDQRVLDR